ncbi:tRNA nucleotidyltransferase (CCA-adding enzyme) [Candidatus Mancarchaeum acidiphilum]|uniref:CCA-adding enzyme n=1 Tax=Candidatus Mancarchaeum acidiphilum TaxID=1920749 RepID=A0A218NM59_9ARCH|nr:CCA tRNA nucleotidyltransferase [Candidatus Mancarchaeum acidiphilum]ASI13542.1 tRNA nucleotidyltransferase (CCA-adding enzyme) [Candidatus Mancarchaeum acidiphilum]
MIMESSKYLYQSNISGLMPHQELSYEDKKKLENLSKLSKLFIERVRPTKTEILNINKYSSELIDRLKKVLPENVEITLAGSTAHGTQVKGSSDIDIFMLFPRSSNERAMEEEAIKLSKNIVREKEGEKYEIKYAEHPYLKLINESKNITADIVPAFKIGNAKELITAVDRTPLHNKFIASHLSKEMKDDVRLLKYFLKMNKIYGAESKTHSFSGYECEILVYFYGSFPNTIMGLSNIKLPLVIDVKNRKFLEDDSRTEYIKRLNSNFIIIDPTDPNRNVAASTSPDSLAKIILISRRLLSNPTEYNLLGMHGKSSFRSIREMLKNYNLSIYAISINVSKEIHEDTLWPQIIKLENQLSSEFLKFGFNPIISLDGIERNKAYLSFIFEKTTKSINLLKGPEVFINGGAEKFYEKHRELGEVFIRGYNLYAIEKSKLHTPIEVLNELNINGKIKIKDMKEGSEIKIFTEKNIPKEMDSIILKNFIDKTTL